MLKLIDLINTIPDWYNKFQNALESVLQYDLDEFSHIHDLNDWLQWCNDFIYWIPIETAHGSNVSNKTLTFYFFFNQRYLINLQNRPILSNWMVEYAKARGNFLDSIDSLTAESLRTFYENPSYRLNEYMQSPSGWATFNQFFARQVKAGYRPIDYLCDDHYVVSVADSNYKGCWNITSNSEIIVKDIAWSINELLDNNPYANYFKDGKFMHAHLKITDYHRLHTPLSGKVLYIDIIPGRVFLETHIVKNKLMTRRSKYKIKAEDSVGYQFTQARAIVILKTAFGIIGIIPVGMELVSSIIINTDVGCKLHKGQEFGYFQFGASDYILLFSNDMKVNMTAEIDQHYDQGQQIGLII